MQEVQSPVIELTQDATRLTGPLQVTQETAVTSDEFSGHARNGSHKWYENSRNGKQIIITEQPQEVASGPLIISRNHYTLNAVAGCE